MPVTNIHLSPLNRHKGTHRKLLRRIVVLYNIGANLVNIPVNLCQIQSDSRPLFRHLSPKINHRLTAAASLAGPAFVTALAKGSYGGGEWAAPAARHLQLFPQPQV
ncbi:MAG: hypothetical protein K8S55_10445 [Phycisphaerae bacterium]|nr:hypothetical protein [Phycisphaerae bacterium]